MASAQKCGGVHRHQHHLRVLRFRPLQLGDEGIEKRHGGRADIGTMGKAEEHESPVAFEPLPEEWLAVVINQLYFAEVSRSFQQI